MEYVTNLSCGKDSLAMVLRLLEEKKPLTKCVMFDTGMEYKAIYNNLEKIKNYIKRIILFLVCYVGSNISFELFKIEKDEIGFLVVFITTIIFNLLYDFSKE